MVYLVVILGYSFFVPFLMNPEIAGAVLPPYRVLLLGSSLFVAYTWLQTRMKLVWSDVLILLGVFWISVAMFVNSDPASAAKAVVSNFADIALPYFLARVTFRTPRDFRVFLILMAPALLLVGTVIMVESVTHDNFVYKITSAIFGESKRFNFYERLGLIRGFGPFPHPILAGLFLVSFFSIYVLSGLRKWPLVAGIVASLLSFFTLSSATLFALAASFFAVVFNWLTERYEQLKWKLLLAAITIMYLALEFGSQNGAYSVVARYLSLNSTSAMHRRAIWQHGTKNIAQNPWFGLGYNDWERPDWMMESVDHYWLLLAMQFGAIVPFIIGLAIVIAIANAGKASQYGPIADARMLRGLAISLAIFSISIFSVSIWLSVQAWFYILFGVTVTLSQRALALSRQAQQAHLVRLRAEQAALGLGGQR